MGPDAQMRCEEMGAVGTVVWFTVYAQTDSRALANGNGSDRILGLGKNQEMARDSVLFKSAASTESRTAVLISEIFNGDQNDLLLMQIGGTPIFIPDHHFLLGIAI